MAGDLELSSSTGGTIHALAFGGSLSVASGEDTDAAFAGAGAGTHNTVTNTVEAYISNGSEVGSATDPLGSVTLSAADSTEIIADAGGAALALGDDASAVSIGASVAINTVTASVRAEVEDSNVTAGSVQISAVGMPVIDALTIAGSFSGSNDSVAFGGAGSGSGNYITSTIEALIQNSTVTSSGNLILAATDGSAITADAGSGALAVAVGGDSTQAGIAVGAAAAVNEIVTTARSVILDSEVAVAGAADLDALSSASIDAFTLGISGTRPVTTPASGSRVPARARATR